MPSSLLKLLRVSRDLPSAYAYSPSFSLTFPHVAQGHYKVPVSLVSQILLFLPVSQDLAYAHISYALYTCGCSLLLTWHLDYGTFFRTFIRALNGIALIYRFPSDVCFFRIFLLWLVSDSGRVGVG